MKRIFAFSLSVAVASACSSSPSTPSAQKPASYPAATVTLTANAGAADRSIFGASSADFARCLQAAGDAACFSASRLNVRQFVENATAPGGPANLVATSSGGTVTLTWSAPTTGDPASAYTIEAGSAPGLANLANFSTGNAATTFSASGVGNGTYYVRVRAQNAAGTSAASNEATLVVGAAACSGAPGAPSGLTGSATGGAVTLSWSAPSGGCPITSYVLQAGSAPGLSDLANSAVGSSTNFSTSGVPGGTYYIRVRAQNASGQSAASNEFTLTVGGGTTSGAISVTVGATVVLYSTSFTSACNSGDAHWSYTQTIHAGSVGVTVTGRTNVIDGAVVSQPTSNYVIPANGTFNFGTTTWCTSGTAGHIVQTTWTGTDARGNSFSYVGPAVTLLGSGATSTTPQHFAATWVSASWLSNTGLPLNSRGIEAPTHVGALCPPNSLVLEFRPSYDPFDDYLYATNTSCTPTMSVVAFCRTSGSGGGSSSLPICSIDPRKTPSSNLYFSSPIHTHTPIGYGPNNFDVNAFWCSSTSTFNLGKYPSLDNLECVQ